jgi:NTP pyrophosphatase (non-canonical NTP hydrolase)
MDLDALTQRALQIHHQYQDLNERRFGRGWTRDEIALGFMGDVGDLMKLVIAQNGVRDIPDSGAKLAHELADCLWSVLVLSQLYHVDLENAFMQTMNEIEAHIAAQKRL